jgi:hypothetical protein
MNDSHTNNVNRVEAEELVRPGAVSQEAKLSFWAS